MVRLPRNTRVVAGVALSLLVAGCHGDRAAPAQVQDLPGVWIGELQSHWGSMYRLELNGEGGGFLSVIAQNTQPPHAHLYEITHWALDDGRFTCTLRQLAPQSHQVPLRIRGTAVAPAFLYLDIAEQEASGNWRSSELHMVTESSFLEDLDRRRESVQRLRARMEAYRSDKSWHGE